MEKTKNLGLLKPDRSDFFSVDHQNDNLDKIDEEIGNKVDKAEGKGLSANDFTDEEKGKLAGVAPGAQVNVQADWDVADETSDAFIRNKPAIPTVPAALKNPQALTFTGGVTGAYDGSVAKTVKIPSIAADIGAAPCSMVENGDFNSMTAPGIYTMRGSSTKNKPTTGNYHGLIVLKSDSGTYVQQIATKEGTTEVYVRYGSSSWGSWVRLLRDGDTVASAANATNAVNATKAMQDGNGDDIANTYTKKEWTLLGEATARGGSYRAYLSNRSEISVVFFLSSTSTEMKNYTFPASVLDKLVDNGVSEVELSYSETSYVIMKEMSKVSMGGGVTFVNNSYNGIALIYAR